MFDLSKWNNSKLQSYYLVVNQKRLLLAIWYIIFYSPWLENSQIIAMSLLISLWKLHLTYFIRAKINLEKLHSLVLIYEVMWRLMYIVIKCHLSPQFDYQPIQQILTNRHSWCTTTQPLFKWYIVCVTGRSAFWTFSTQRQSMIQENNHTPVSRIINKHFFYNITFNTLLKPVKLFI